LAAVLAGCGSRYKTVLLLLINHGLRRIKKKSERQAYLRLSFCLGSWNIPIAIGSKNHDKQLTPTVRVRRSRFFCFK
jgi:hypothetical protein